MISPSTLQRMQADQGRAYREAVETVEARLGAPLPRFRGVEFCFAGYQKPGDLGQGPYYRRFPGLTAKPYWQRSEWPSECRAILTRLEDEYPALRDEFEARIPRARSAFSSQTTGYFGVVDQWLSYPLVTETGEPVPEAFAAFPRLSALLAELVELKFLCKTYFALMKPGVHLPEHCGGQNVALRMHFALRIPSGDAALRVGGIEQRWEDGKQVFFDDTFVHEAWNRTNRDRYILLMRIMHPELSPLERAAHFLIEEAFRGSATFLAMKAEVQAMETESARAQTAGVVLSSTAPSKSSPWVLGPPPRRSSFSSSTPAWQMPPAMGAPLYALRRSRWVTFSSPFTATGGVPVQRGASLVAPARKMTSRG
jgi:hypothetical protein